MEIYKSFFKSDKILEESSVKQFNPSLKINSDFILISFNVFKNDSLKNRYLSINKDYTPQKKYNKIFFPDLNTLTMYDDLDDKIISEIIKEYPHSMTKRNFYKLLTV